jgi:phage-related protein (TIGR01555 family)
MGRARYKTFADNALRKEPIPINSRSVGNDAFSNPAARTGWETPSVAEAADYTLVRWSLNYWLMLTLFRNHWIARKGVEIPAADCCKAWPRLKCSLTPTQIQQFNRSVSQLLIPQKIQRAITWARLYGGAGALMVIDGHENRLDEPLDFDEVNPGTFKGLIVFDRWAGISPKPSLSHDISNPLTFGLPEYYTVYGKESNDTLFDVHASRILRFCGPEVPSPELEASSYWGISVLELAFEELRKRDNASWNILQLMFRAQILTQVNPDLASIVSGLGASQQAAQKYYQIMESQNQLLSNQSMLILPKDGKLESHQYTFGGISEVLDRFEVSTSGAFEIPYSKMFGRNVSALGQINEADERNYEEKIAQYQNHQMKPQLDILYPILCMSFFGEVPEDLDYVFPSIRVLTEKDKAELADIGSTAIIKPFTAGVISQRVTAMELKQLGDKTEMFSNISDKDIENANPEIGIPLEIETMAARSGNVVDPESGEWITLEQGGEGKPPNGQKSKPVSE